MSFKIGDRVILGESKHTRDFQGQKGIVVSREDFLGDKSGSIIDNSYLLIKLDKKIGGRYYWQADSSDCSLFKQPDYNE